MSAPPSTATSTPRARSRTRLLRWWPLAVLLVLAVLVAAWAQRDSTTHDAPLDPQNPGPHGMQALAKVLAQEGVEVEVARSADALTRALEGSPGSETLVVVTLPDRLGASTAERLRTDLTGAGARVVLLAPHRDLDFDALETDNVSSVSVEGGTCALADLAGLELRADSGLEYPGTTGCFVGDDGPLLTAPADGVLAFGAPGALTNEQVLDGDNAAIGLRLLGSGPRTVFYVPDTADLAPDDTSLAPSLLPDFLRPGLVLVVLSVLALMLWRGRRFGPLATEPLPVVVRASESTRARGRMYRRSGDRAHAAAALRRGTRRHLASHLRLPVREERALILQVAAVLDRNPAEVAALLSDSAPAPAHDTDLTHLANDLAALEEEVRTR